VTVAEVSAGYWLFAERYYSWNRDPRRGDAWNTRRTLAILDSLYGSTVAKDLGPLDFRAIQGEMVRLGWCRTMVNHEVGRVKRFFRWAVSEELIPSAVWHSLLSCPSLRKGKSEARETAPVRPIPVKDLDAAKRKLRPAVRAMDVGSILSLSSGPCQITPPGW
jgi:hypothetical protein